MSYFSGTYMLVQFRVLFTVASKQKKNIIFRNKSSSSKILLNNIVQRILL